VLGLVEDVVSSTSPSLGFKMNRYIVADLCLFKQIGVIVFYTLSFLFLCFHSLLALSFLFYVILALHFALFILKGIFLPCFVVFASRF
jgi:hypothetical protein